MQGSRENPTIFDQFFKSKNHFLVRAHFCNLKEHPLLVVLRLSELGCEKKGQRKGE